MLGHIAITAAYLLNLKDHGNGDATGVAATWYSSDDIALIIALPAAIDAWHSVIKPRAECPESRSTLKQVESLPFDSFNSRLASQ